jgi:hypothetical protein
LILKLEQVSFQVPNVEKQETILLANSLTGIGANINQSQFSSSKSVKTRETILFAISLTGKGAYLSQSHFS